MESFEETKTASAEPVQSETESGEFVARARPERIRISPVRANIWTNVDKYGQEYKVVDIARTYKVPDTGEFKDTTRLRAQDVPKAILVLQMAYEKMVNIQVD